MADINVGSESRAPSEGSPNEWFSRSSISPSSSTTTSIETPSSDSAEGEIASNAAEMMTIGFEFNLNPFDWVRVTDQEAIGVPVQPENAEVLRLRAAWSASIPELDPTKFRLLSQSPHVKFDDNSVAMSETGHLLLGIFIHGKGAFDCVCGEPFNRLDNSKDHIKRQVEHHLCRICLETHEPLYSKEDAQHHETTIHKNENLLPRRVPSKEEPEQKSVGLIYTRVYKGF